MTRLFCMVLCLLISIECSTFSAETIQNEQLKIAGYKAVSNGLRLANSWKKLSQPRCMFRFRRKAMVDMKGELKLIFPTFYAGRRPGAKPVEEIPFPNNIKIQAAIEPEYKLASTSLDPSGRIVSDVITCEKESEQPYKILTVDLGEVVIKKGQWYGVWVLVENVDGEKYLPFSRSIGSKKMQNYEGYHSPTGVDLFKEDALRTLTSFKPQPVDRDWARYGFCPVAILAKTDYKGDVWGVLGSSIPHGYYDIKGDQYGDENGNAGYADKLLSTCLGCPSVNLAIGSDRFQYCLADSKRRLEILKVCNVNKVHYGLGGNDISGMRNEKKLMADSKALSKLVRDKIPGVYIVGATILPHSTSKDKFKTLQGQTPRAQNAGPDSYRGKWNALIRADPSASGCDDIFEICSYVEYGWKTSESLWGSETIAPDTLTKDGTHPTCLGSEVIAKHAYLLHDKK